MLLFLLLTIKILFLSVVLLPSLFVHPLTPLHPLLLSLTYPLPVLFHFVPLMYALQTVGDVDQSVENSHGTSSTFAPRRFSLDCTSHFEKEDVKTIDCFTSVSVGACACVSVSGSETGDIESSVLTAFVVPQIFKRTILKSHP